MVIVEEGKGESEQISWLEKVVVPKIVKVLGKDGENSRCEIKVPTDNFFISSVYMVELIFSNGAGGTESERVKLVVKVQPDDESTRAYMRTEILFNNEIVFYKRFGKNYEGFPKCVLTLSEPRVLIVLENVTQFGYESLKSKEEMKMERVLAAIREMGKFHARGYVLKEKNPEEFYAIAKELREVYDDSAHPLFIKFCNTVSLRPVNYLRTMKYDSKFCDEISTVLSNSFEKILEDCVKPRNELAVLCHGDFTSNNILFGKDDDGKFEAMLIDFAQFRYASPATDVSTFLYLSCEDDARKNFSAIFRAYHDAIVEHLEEQGIQDLGKYSFSAFLDDYKRHAILGCEVALFFLPIVYLGVKQFDFDDFIKNNFKHYQEAMASGGDVVSKRLADMLLELKDNGCLDHLI